MIDYLTPAFGTASKNVTSDVYISAKRWFAALDPGKQKLADYRTGLLSSLGHIQIMGMPSARKLETIYVGLRAVPNIKKFVNQVSPNQVAKPQQIIAESEKFLTRRQTLNIDKFITNLGYERIIEDAIDDDTADYRRSRSEIFTDLSQAEAAAQATALASHGVQATSIIEKNDRIVILGHPGSGKTTFLKYLALAYAGHLPIHAEAKPRLPIFVPLREMKRVGTPKPTAEWLHSLALSCAQDISTKVFSKEWLEDALQGGACVVLLDGIDEVPQGEIDTVIQSIKSFSIRYRSNKFVVTCRVASFDRSLDDYHICEIDDFNEDDIEKFLKQWFGSNTSDAQKIKFDIKSSSLARELCKTPLLLTLICILYGYRRSIPENRAELYEACIDALLFRWDTFRAVDRQPILKDSISPERKKLLLSRIAAKTYFRGIIYFQKDAILKMIRSELDLANFSGVSEIEFLKEIESHNGMLVEHAIGIYCFSHLTFHEFFTALYYHDTKNYAELFQRTVKSTHYNEIFLMALEKMYNADKWIMHLMSYVSNEIRTGSLRNSTVELIEGVLAGNCAINPKLKRALREMAIDIEAMSVPDEANAGLQFDEDNPIEEDPLGQEPLGLDHQDILDDFEEHEDDN